MAEQDTTTRREQEQRDPSFFGVLRETALIVVLSLAIATVVRIFVVQAFLIPSESMEDTLLKDDRVLVSKLSTTFGSLARGDVVVFEDPGGWLGPEAQRDESGVGGAVRGALEFVGVLPSDTEGHLIKRIIGVGGDRVRCCDARGRIQVNGTSVDETQYLYPGDAPSLEPFDVTVPAGKLWVMGDHRSNSGDSRVHGFVPEDRVVGRAVLVVWPLDRLAVLDRPDDFDQVPAPRARGAVRPAASGSP